MSNRDLAKVAFVWLLIVFVSATLSVYFGHSSWNQSRVHYLAYISPLTRLLDFMVGMLVYRISLKHPPQGKIPHEVLSAVMIVAAMYIYSTNQIPDVLRSQLLYLPLMAYVVWSFSSGNGLISRMISRPSIVLLGEASFALYMIHQPIINHGYAAYNKFQPPFNLAALAVILTIVSIAGSIIVYRHVELPIHNALRGLIARYK
ncbi:MAG: acyltransferase [Sphingobacteriales bacterium]|nr:MAG: acyltransferase [Sphingobacteriales bacterium]